MVSRSKMGIRKEWINCGGIIMTALTESLVRLEIAKITLRDIFLHCIAVETDSKTHETQSVEYIMKYSQTFPEEVCVKAMDEFLKNKQKIFSSLDFDMIDLLEEGGWEKE